MGQGSQASPMVVLRRRLPGPGWNQGTVVGVGAEPVAVAVVRRRRGQAIADVADVVEVARPPGPRWRCRAVVASVSRSVRVGVQPGSYWRPKDSCPTVVHRIVVVVIVAGVALAVAVVVRLVVVRVDGAVVHVAADGVPVDVVERIRGAGVADVPGPSLSASVRVGFGVGGAVVVPQVFAGNPGSPHPSLSVSVQVSQASPTPSLSASSWAALAAEGQLSQTLPRPSRRRRPGPRWPRRGSCPRRRRPCRESISLNGSEGQASQTSPSPSESTSVWSGVGRRSSCRKCRRRHRCPRRPVRVGDGWAVVRVAADAVPVAVVVGSTGQASQTSPAPSAVAVLLARVGPSGSCRRAGVGRESGVAPAVAVRCRCNCRRRPRRRRCPRRTGRDWHGRAVVADVADAVHVGVRQSSQTSPIPSLSSSSWPGLVTSGSCRRRRRVRRCQRQAWS